MMGPGWALIAYSMWLSKYLVALFKKLLSLSCRKIFVKNRCILFLCKKFDKRSPDYASIQVSNAVQANVLMRTQMLFNIVIHIAASAIVVVNYSSPHHVCPSLKS